MKSIALSSLRLAAGALLGFGLIPAARAQDTAVPAFIHSFDPREGDQPGQLVQGSDGNFYGTTMYGGFGYNSNQGQSGNGTVYRVTPSGNYSTLYAFPGGAQGQNPSGLIQGIDGNFYGVTDHGGAVGDGTVFRVTPSGQLTTVYSFTDAASVAGPLVQDGSGNFYGVRTATSTTGGGSIFRLSATGEYTTQHTFTGGNDGSSSSGLIKGNDGNFYGTSNGGGDGGGAIYRITPAGGFTVLHRFAEQDGFSFSGLTLGSDGNFYGTSAFGGASSRGEVYRFTPAGEFTVLYSFTGGSDGVTPGGRLVEGKDGNFYGFTSGTTYELYQPAVQNAAVDPAPDAIIAGPPIPATVYRITPQGVLTPLYASSYGYGGSSFSSLILGSDGNFYGTSIFGDFVFRLDIVSHPSFFAYQAPLGSGTYYLSFANGNPFGYYAFSSDPNSIYHFDLGPEYLFDANDGQRGLYMYDFRSQTYFYTSPTFPFPYLYDFSLQSVVYYFPDPNNPGRYNSQPGGKRYFYVFRTGAVVLK